MADAIVRDHSFFACSFDPSAREEFSDGRRVIGALQLSQHEKLNTKEYHHNLLKDKLYENSIAFNKLLFSSENSQGIFWGVKMYRRVGVAPDDFNTYPHLHDFYQHCRIKKIPITFHCSRGGMSIADYYNYQRYVKGKETSLPEYNLKKADEYFADHYTSPANWAEVLSKYNDLKVCFAHFGGSDVWDECSDFADREKEADGEKKKERYKLWIRKIAELVQEHPNVYTDISYFLNNYFMGLSRRCAARNMVFLLKKFPDLKDRLIMGSDWYMIEKDRMKGTGLYYYHMFQMLQKVSEEVKYDAWHQFAVVNPLRYLGLIDEKKGGKGPWEIKTVLLERYGENLKKKLKVVEWRRKANITEDITTIKDNISNTAKLIKTITICDSDTILKHGKLLILTD